MSLEIYQKLVVLKENEKKSIYIVRNEIDKLLYIQRCFTQYEKNVYIELKKIHSPFLPRIYEIIEQDEKLYIIEEYINALTLEKSLLNNEIDDETKEKIIIQLCEAVELLHAHKIIHRDIKPDNIFYYQNHIVLFDFDISRQFHEYKKKDTTILGSVGYAAPEQFGFRQTDARTDIYAIGVLINYMFTLHLPNDDLYTGKYMPIIKKATALDPQQRFQTISELKRSLIKEDKQPWTLPGFRSERFINKVMATVGYMLFIYLFITTEIEGIKHGSLEELVNKISVFGVLVIAFLYCTNYRGIIRYALFSQSKNKTSRVLGIVLSWIVIELIYMVVAGSLMSLWE